ncbi:MAG: hypothetical protein V4613_01540 [Bacteroidota bacterium]
MRNFCLLFCVFFCHALYSQKPVKAALSFNFAQLFYQCYEVNAHIASTDKQYQLIGALNFTAASTNGTQMRNVNTFDKRYMKGTDDLINGMGYGLAFRKSISQREGSPFRLMVNIGSNIYQYKINFFENEYVQENDGYYHYTTKEYKSSFKRVSLDGQLVLAYDQSNIFGEFGAGIAYYNSRIPADLEAHRNYHYSNVDYGFTGIGPVFSLRFGIWLF